MEYILLNPEDGIEDKQEEKIESVLERMVSGIKINYINWHDIEKDLIKINRSSYAVKRIVAFLLNNLKQIVNYPIFIKSKDERGGLKYMYDSLDEMNDVEDCIIFALYKVAKRVRERDQKYCDYFNKIDIYNKSLNSIKKILAVMVRNNATADIYKTLGISNLKIGYKTYLRKKVVCMDNEVLAETINKAIEIKSTVENKIMGKELNKLINNVIDNFLIDKNKLDTTIFLNYIMASAKYEKYVVEKLTEQRISKLCGVSEITVRRRKRKLLEQFRQTWKEEIEPYL
ncbi:hypothetical protein [Clostridium sp. JN-9]|uniref:hypothetical protein n=1 Tax=Clostridium sp. JN-9 TaxID=2507159 RepID=UPI000FFE2B2B|nr:hypothetical protein [Clostridium sp. JN-9]QAT39521.1 hypothetical protein EQM05_04240 [Clostridium sp. JN-9]